MQCVCVGVVMVVVGGGGGGILSKIASHSHACQTHVNLSHAVSRAKNRLPQSPKCTSSSDAVAFVHWLKNSINIASRT